MLGLTGGDEPNTLGGVLSFGDGIVFDVVDDQELVVVLELGGQLRTGVGSACRREKDTHGWAVSHWRWLLVMW